ncbi:MAG: tRNA 2-thiouridine(34) synthase MnmA [Polyangiaceae bacterium]
MTERARVVIAMSGGVDSSVAAARLVDQGYDVVGVTLHLWDYPDDGSERGRCCAPEDQHDARRVADVLGIPHFTFDRRELFQEHVVSPFVDAYLQGETPSPCVAYNRTVKLRELFPLADRLGAAFVATGHYARVVHEEGKARLYRGVDAQKDQSYFLHMLREDELARLVFPLGASTKPEVRAEAVARKLPGATKGESQELCFVPAGQYGQFVEDRARGRVRPGPILGPDNTVLGSHHGVHAFTIGQRKGLGIAVGKPLFVTAIDGPTAAVHVAGEDALLAAAARFDQAVWSEDVTLPAEATVRVRSRHEGERATLLPAGDGTFIARFHAPVRAVSPGQILVAYSGDRVLGGGRITAALPRAEGLA